MCTDSPKEENKTTCYELLGKRSSSSSFNTPAMGLSVLLLTGNSQGPSGNTADQIPTPKGNLLLGQLNNVQEEESGAATWCLLHFRETLDSLSYIHPSTCKSIQQQQHPFYPSNVRETGLDEIKQL